MIKDDVLPIKVKELKESLEKEKQKKETFLSKLRKVREELKNVEEVIAI